MQNLYGSSSVLTALQCNRRRITKLLLNESYGYQKLSKNGTARFQEMAKNLAIKQSIPIEYCSKSQLDKLSGGRPNQGLILQVSKLDMIELKSLGRLDGSKYLVNTEDGEEEIEANHKFPFWLLLDEIVDPENLGSILRTSYSYGVDGVILTEGCAKLTPTVSKASAGSLEINPPYVLGSLTKFLRKVVASEWNIFGTNLKGENVVHINTDLPSIPLLTSPTLLVVGNEGTGTRSTVDQFSTADLVISSFPDHNLTLHYHVDSINVSVATGILIQQILASKS